MSKWEYKVIKSKLGIRGAGDPRRRSYGGGGNIELETLEEMINDLAGEGWEAVNITASNPYQKESYIYCLLRRKMEL